MVDEDEENIIDVKGTFNHQEDEFASEDKKDSATAPNKRSRRTSHLRLELSTKEASAPWEQVSSPQNGHLKSITQAGCYSPTASQQKIGNP